MEMSYQESYCRLMEPIQWLKPKNLRNLINMSKNRAEDISYILEGISTISLQKTTFSGKHNLSYKAQYRNLNEDKDLARIEFTGAIQKYLLGFNTESIIASCASVENALIIMHEINIKNNVITYDDIKHPFMLSTSIALATNNKGFIKDNDIKNVLNDIKYTRNMMAHQSNFLFPLLQMLKYYLPEEPINKEIFEVIKNMQGIDEKEFSEMAQIANLHFEKSQIRKILRIFNSGLMGEILDDAQNVQEKLQHLSDFKEFTTKENINHFNKLLDGFLSSEEKYKLDIFYYLSNKTLKQAYILLKHLSFY